METSRSGLRRLLLSSIANLPEQDNGDNFPFNLDEKLRRDALRLVKRLAGIHQKDLYATSRKLTEKLFQNNQEAFSHSANRIILSDSYEDPNPVVYNNYQESLRTVINAANPAGEPNNLERLTTARRKSSSLIFK